jgi:hypothetical protein
VGVVLAMPLQYLHDCPGLPRVYFFRAFPGDNADLEPDLYPAPPLPLRYIIADHTDIITYFRRIHITVTRVYRLAAARHSPILS